MLTPSALPAGMSFSKKPRSSRSVRLSASSCRIRAITRSSAARSAVSREPSALVASSCARVSSRSRDTSSRSRTSSSRERESSPAMLLPNSKAHRAMAAHRPKNTASTIQRRGQGMALRIATRGALTVSLRRSSLSRMRQPSSKKRSPNAKNRQ